MKMVLALALAAVLMLAACGDDDEEGAAPATTAAPAQQAEEAPAEEPAEEEEAPPGADHEGRAEESTRIVLAGSEFGDMLFDSKKQAIYIFERDEPGKSNCYGECAEAWPPVFTEEEPEAGKGVKDSLLGTTKRRDGRLQVTYDEKPLYFYAHEEPNEVRCHNINLNGGFWWVVGADGKRLP